MKYDELAAGDIAEVIVGNKYFPTGTTILKTTCGYIQLSFTGGELDFKHYNTSDRHKGVPGIDAFTSEPTLPETGVFKLKYSPRAESHTASGEE